MDVTIEDFNNLFDMTDKDQSGTVDADEFVEVLHSMRHKSERTTLYFTKLSSKNAVDGLSRRVVAGPWKQVHKARVPSNFEKLIGNGVETDPYMTPIADASAEQFNGRNDDYSPFESSF